jgi:hypothetical protein
MCRSNPVLEHILDAASMSLDEQAFSEKMTTIINHGMVGLMISVGHRTGLFSAMKVLGPVSSVELGGRTDLDERYVREWLGAMAGSGIVSVDPATMHYSLPDVHAAFLGKDAVSGSMSSMFQLMGLLGAAEPIIADCFNGGGAQYPAHDRVHDYRVEDSGQPRTRALEDEMLTLAPGLIAQLESGIDVAVAAWIARLSIW